MVPAIRLPILVIAIAVALSAWLLLAPPAGLPPAAANTAALAVVAIAFWATGRLPEHVVALAFLLGAVLLKVAPPPVVFSGFSSTAWWLIFGGLIIGVAVRRTGLGDRVAIGLSALFGRRYPGLVIGITVIGLVLGFILPSSIGRAVLLLPIAAALAERHGFVDGRPGRTGIVLAAAFAVHLPTFAILPANVPNMVLAGAAEQLYGYTPLYGHYLLLHFPVLGLLKAAATVVLILWMFHDRTPAGQTASEAPALSRRPSRDEWRLTLLIMVSLALWVTDFLHHISPAWVSLAAGIVCLLPATGLVPPKSFAQEVPYGTLFYIAGIMALGAVVAHSGLGDVLAHRLLAILPLAPGAEALNFAAMSMLGTLIGLATTLPGVPAVLTPLAADLSQATGWPLQTVLMAQVLGFSTVLFPYESGPLVVGAQLSGAGMAAALKLCLALAIVTIVFLLPLDFLWWRLLGEIG